jgi:hypothetical protein
MRAMIATAAAMAAKTRENDFLNIRTVFGS